MFLHVAAGKTDKGVVRAIGHAAGPFNTTLNSTFNSRRLASVTGSILFIHVTQNVNSIATKPLRKATFSVSERCKMKFHQKVFVSWWQGV